MIHESYYWKKELYNDFITISKIRQNKRIYEKSFVKLERALMMGAFIIRKLDEAQKIPPDFLYRQETLEFFVNKGEIVDHMNWHKIDEHYDLSTRTKQTRNWKYILNQLIHSFTLVYVFDDENKLDGIFINTDNTKKDALLYLPIKLILTIFLSISEGSIVKTNSSRDIIGKDENGNFLYGEMKLRDAVYAYPDGFKLDNIICDALNGLIYKKQNNIALTIKTE